jgi:hypothetical protein
MYHSFFRRLFGDELARFSQLKKRLLEKAHATANNP